MQTTEAEWVERCQRGDMTAFEAIYAQYERQVFRYAYRILGQREDADDVKQETFLKAYQAIDRFRHDASLQTWLLKICANVCRDRMRSWEHRKVQYDSSLFTDSWRPACEDSDPRYVVERMQTKEIIFSALQGLPAPLREAVTLHDLEGLDYDEMSKILECSRASAKLRVFRARRALKERVESMMKAR